MNLSWREKKQLGLLRVQLAFSLIGLARDGVDVKSMSVDELSVLLLADAQEKHPEAWDKVRAGRDWETFFKALADFLKEVVPVLLELFALFL